MTSMSTAWPLIAALMLAAHPTPNPWPGSEAPGDPGHKKCYLDAGRKLARTYVRQCIQVVDDQGFHGRCNATNSCAFLKHQIQGGCWYIQEQNEDLVRKGRPPGDLSRAPAFCARYGHRPGPSPWFPPH